MFEYTLEALEMVRDHLFKIIGAQQASVASRGDSDGDAPAAMNLALFQAGLENEDWPRSALARSRRGCHAAMRG